jgi:hypothetical protein
MRAAGRLGRRVRDLEAAKPRGWLAFIETMTRTEMQREIERLEAELGPRREGDDEIEAALEDPDRLDEWAQAATDPEVRAGFRELADLVRGRPFSRGRR